MLQKSTVRSSFASFALTLLSCFQWASAEPVSALIHNGDNANRVNIVILGDGYAAFEMRKYAKDVEKLRKRLFNEEPFKEYENYFNVHRVDVTSKESGADHPETSLFKDTAFDATYQCAEIQRLICINYSKVNAVLSNSVSPNQRDIVIVLVNDPEYGGSGGEFAVASVNPAVVDLVLHELGHSFGGLADEYIIDGPECNATIEPSAPNVTLQTNRSLIKWNIEGGPPTGWIDFNTPIPTLKKESEVPGLYQGANYCAKKLFRSSYDSKMRSIDAAFEQVNEEQLIKRIYNRVSPIDSSYPVSSELLVEYGTTQEFAVNIPEPRKSKLVTNWFVDGELVSQKPEFTLQSLNLGFGRHEVKIEVLDPTHKVRNDPEEILKEQRSWNVTIVDATMSCGNELLITDISVPAKDWRKNQLIDNDISPTSFWRNEGDTWLNLSLNGKNEIKCITLAPRADQTYIFDVHVDGQFIAQYTTERAATVSSQRFRLPAGTTGSVVHLESIGRDRLKVHEIKLRGKTALNKSQSVINPEVPVKSLRKNKLFDNKLHTFWNNDGERSTAWFELKLDGLQEIKTIHMAPRIGRAYTFNVYADDILAGQFTTESSSKIALQSFILPAGTVGSTLRVKSVSHPWFKIYEIKLDTNAVANTSCSTELAISNITVASGEHRKKRLIDNSLSSKSFWVSESNTWFELSLNGEHDIKCLQLAPGVERSYTIDIYVDNKFITQLTTEASSSIAMQHFILPAGTKGSTMRIEAVNHNWFKLYEVKLLGDSH